MKKTKYIIISIVVVLVVCVVAIGIFVAGLFAQKKKMMDELDNVTAATTGENWDIDEVYEVLDRTVTTGGFVDVEHGIKHWFKDYMTVLDVLMNTYEEPVVFNALSVENYTADGPDFVETKAELDEVQQTLEWCLQETESLMTEERIMSYIDEDANPIYVKLYQYSMTDSDLIEENQTEILELIEDAIAWITAEQEVIDFLIENQGEWEVEDGQVCFSRGELVDQYNEMLTNLQGL